LKGALELCILGVLRHEPAYGYDLAQTLAESGLGEIKGGTLYPALTRLEEAGHVTTEWRPGPSGPKRKYYAVTESGRTWLGDKAAEWEGFTDAVATLTAGHREAKS
jgi:PadR family transcriptional regulator PadR